VFLLSMCRFLKGERAVVLSACLLPFLLITNQAAPASCSGAIREPSAVANEVIEPQQPPCSQALPHPQPLVCS
jgi:hypothetical protein